ncbi:unnamed protein product [Closterium sp. Yama58-4]|nr:unnamed protein product [Closterium sp. Yama58-4]
MRRIAARLIWKSPVRGKCWFGGDDGNSRLGMRGGVQGIFAPPSKQMGSASSTLSSNGNAPPATTASAPSYGVFGSAGAASGGQLFVSLRLVDSHPSSPLESAALDSPQESGPSQLVPHVVGAHPLVGAWDPLAAVPMERDSLCAWQLNVVLPAQHAPLEFKVVLKTVGGMIMLDDPCLLEEGPPRQIIAGHLAGPDSSRPARFLLRDLWKKTEGRGGEGGSSSAVGGSVGGSAGESAGGNAGESGEEVAFPVEMSARAVSPFVLAAAWKLYDGAISSQGTLVRGIPDVCADALPLPTPSHASPVLAPLLSDSLVDYEVPPPPHKVPLYAADATEDPRFLRQSADAPLSASLSLSSASPGAASVGGAAVTRVSSAPHSTGHTPQQSPSPMMRSVVSIKDLVLLGEEEQSRMDQAALAAAAAGEHAHEPGAAGEDVSAAAAAAAGLVQHPRLSFPEDLPEAAGAVAAAAAAERLLGPKERRRLAIIMVGLPARGKTFTAAKLTRYLRWLGHETKHFNVGKYRRLKLGASQTSDFFRADNYEGIEARNEVAVEAFTDMLAWMDEGGQVGVFDATNSTRARRNMLLELAEHKCKVIFLECICDDAAVIDRNAREKIKASPDYTSIASHPMAPCPMPRIDDHRADAETALNDFRSRLDNYQQVYEPVEEGSYIKLINMVSGSSGQLQVNNISGYLPGRIVFFLLNTHITPRPVLLTRHGESMDNVRGRIGGDPLLSPAGEIYAEKLSEFVHKRLRNERLASVWTSTLRRTIRTGRHIAGFPKVQWRALDEIDAGVCDGMTYLEIRQSMPDEYRSRKADKLRYRYPRGESYLDVIQRLEPVIIELERQRHPVVIIAHQAVLRALYAYFMDKPLREVPHIEVGRPFFPTPLAFMHHRITHTLTVASIPRVAFTHAATPPCPLCVCAWSRCHCTPL